MPSTIGDLTTGTPQVGVDIVRSALARVSPERIDDLDRVDVDVDLWHALDLDSLDHIMVMEFIADATGSDIAEREYPRLLSIRQLSAHVAHALK